MDPHPPPPPSALPALDGPSGPLARAAPPAGRVFSAAGAGAVAWGTELAGPTEVLAPDWTLLADLDAGCGPSAAVVVGPFALRREALGPGGSVIETFLLPAELPGAVLQWRRPEGDRSPLRSRVTFRIGRREGGPLAVETEGGEARVRAPGDVDDGVRVRLDPPPSDWHVHHASGGVRLEAVSEAAAGAPLTLLVAAAGPRLTAARALERLTRLGVEEARTERAAQVALETGLVIRAGEALDRALAWAKLRVGGATAPLLTRSTGRTGAAPEPGDAGTIRRGGGACAGPAARSPAGDDGGPLGAAAEEAWVALGALAGGDPSAAQSLLGGALPTPLHLLVVARLVAWRGEPGVLPPVRPRLERAVARALEAPDPRDAVVATAALRELADAWEALDPAEAARLRAQLGARRSTLVAGDPGPGSGSERGARAPAHGRRLPTLPAGPLARPAHADEVRLLAAALGVAGGGTLPTGSPLPSQAVRTLARMLDAWAHFAAGEPDRAARLLDEHVRAVHVYGTGLWPDRPPASPANVRSPACLDSAAAAATLPVALLFGLLGGSADAALGRVRLAPRVPAAWTSFAVAGIAVGDAAVELDHRCEGGVHEFRVSQPRGRVPLMLVLEPEVAGREVLGVDVDGVAAALDVSSRKGRCGVRVQLPLDRERRVTLAVAPGP